MKKIYYLQKHEVKLGDIIEYNGIKALVTEELIELNPELFKIEGKKSKQELLDEAKKRYPVGTVYKHLNSEYTPKIDFLVADKSDYHFHSAGYFQNAIWGSGLDKYYGVVYHEGKWAEILPLKFTTEDGVSIYGDMKTYLVHSNDDDLQFSHSIWKGNSVGNGNKYFYHKENALAYIEKHKEKTLKDYENMLFKSENNSLVVFSLKGSYFSVYSWIRDNEPKLYYTKILQLIADDLNGGRYIHERGQVSLHINKEGGVNLHMGDDEGCVYFKSNELAQRAINILGDKLECLFNQA